MYSTIACTTNNAMDTHSSFLLLYSLFVTDNNVSITHFEIIEQLYPLISVIHCNARGIKAIQALGVQLWNGIHFTAVQYRQVQVIKLQCT